MKNLESLYSGVKSSSDNSLCVGCTILDKNKPCHSVMDYKKLQYSDVLFLSDSLKYKYGEVSPFSVMEHNLIKSVFSHDFQAAASVKCPSVKEVDMSPNNMNICRQHLDSTIQAVLPKLVFPCGNLAMKMLVKKSGITDKRGKSYEFTTTAGHTCIVVPIFHPYAVLKEPRHRYLFEIDIKNAHEKYVLGKTGGGNFSYKTLMQLDEVRELEKLLRDSSETLACDIETTGLNFLTDKIQTIAISSKDNNWVIPCDHKDSPFCEGEERKALWANLNRILGNPKSKKVFHNAKFDLKFLMNYGIRPKNVWDTKVMHHLLDENLPKSLMDLVKLYFATELEDL